MPPQRLSFLFGAAWLSVMTMLVLYLISSVNTLIQIQQEVLRVQNRHVAEYTPSILKSMCPSCPQCAACPVIKCPDLILPQPVAPAPAPPPPPPSVECPKCPTLAAPASAVAAEITAPTSSSCSRPERVKPILRWLGMDAGRDFYHHLISWDKKARSEHALIVEVGAGDGRQAVTSASLGYRVISVDANKNNIETGKGFIKEKTENMTGSVTWIHSAVSDYKGNATFWAYSGMGRLLDDQNPDSMTHKDNPKWRGDRVTVPVNRLDDLIPPHETPFIFKIDVEGHEFSVLKGATELLKRKPPVIILEFNPVMMEWSAKHDAYDALKLLHDMGYDLYDSTISEPLRKGFVKQYGSFHRPRDYRELVNWFKQSAKYDWWGSWTDIVAILP